MISFLTAFDNRPVTASMHSSSIGRRSNSDIKKLLRRSSVKTVLRSAWWSGWFLLIFVSSFSISGVGAPSLEPDASWQAVLEYARDIHLQFGRDLVFTYGPLGFLNDSYSKGHFITVRILFAFFLSTSVSLFAIAIASRMPSWARYIFLLWLTIFALHGNAGFFDATAFFVLTAGGILLAADHYKSWWKIPFVGLGFIFLSLIKFTFFLGAVGIVAAIVYIRLAQRRAREGLLVAGAVGIGFVAGWLLSGQAWRGLPLWISRSIDVSSGYNAAMAVEPNIHVLLCDLAAFVLFLVTVALLAMRRPLNVTRAGTLLIVVLCAALAWKESFVRADGHVMFFTWFLPLAVGFCLLPETGGLFGSSGRVTLGLIYCAISVLCLAAMQFQSPKLAQQQVVSWPKRVKGSVEMIIEIAHGGAASLFMYRVIPAVDRPDALPIAKLTIGDATVDVMGSLQWSAIANGMNYHPRPVMQSYSAYNSALQEINESYFQSQRRPEFILEDEQAIDNRFPTTEDSSALNYVLNNYVPVTQDREFLLLRHGSSEDLSYKVVYNQVLHFGEKVDLARWNAQPLFMSISIHPTLLGRIAGLFYQQRPLYMSVMFGGGGRRYRVIPAMTERPFLISPIIETNDDILNLFRKRPGQRVEEVMLERRRAGSWQYDDLIRVKLYTAPGFPHATELSGPDEILRMKSGSSRPSQP